MNKMPGSGQSNYIESNAVGPIGPPDGPSVSILSFRGLRGRLFSGAIVGLLLAVALVSWKDDVYVAQLDIAPTSSGSANSRLTGLAAQFGVAGALAQQSGNPLASPDVLQQILFSDEFIRRVLISLSGSTFSDSLTALAALAPDYTRFRSEKVDTLGLTNLERDLFGAVVTVRKIPLTQTLRISVRTGRPDLSFAIASTVSSELEQFVTRAAQRSAHLEMSFLNERVLEQSGILKVNEERLRMFLESNESYRSSSARAFEFSSLSSEVELARTVLSNLKQSREEAALRVSRNTPSLIILDPARLPSAPLEKAFLVSGLAGVFVGLTAGFLLSGTARAAVVPVLFGVRSKPQSPD